MSHPTFSGPPYEGGLQRISSILSQRQFVKLGIHLANGRNGKLCFIPPLGPPVIADSEKRSLIETINSTWSSIDNYHPLNHKPFALAIYDRNPESQFSSWAAFDIDHHGSERPGPYELHAYATLSRRGKTWTEQATGRAMIAERSGAGMHVWLISAHPLTLAHWREHLEDLALNVGCAGLETFPRKATRRVEADRHKSNGHALRLPGSVCVQRFNPANGAPISMIESHTGLLSLCRLLPDPPSNIKSVYYGSQSSSQREKNRVRDEERRWLVESKIDRPSCRHERARSLIACVACHRSKSDVLRLCDDLYAQAVPRPRTPPDEHRRDCERLFADWTVKLRSLMTAEETTTLDSLTHPRDEAAFHCLHNWHRLATVKGLHDFPASSEALGRAIGYSYKTARAVLKDFECRGMITETAPAVRRSRCSRYRWSLLHKSADDIKDTWPALRARAQLLPI